MSVRIQLETGYLDVKDGTAFPLNFGVADIRDVSKKSGAFSKTITLTGTDNNHNLLNHYYDINIQAGTFNINTLTRCSIIQNGIPVLEAGYLQLIAVNKSQITADYENEVEYEVLIKDESSEFFTRLGNNELTNLDFSDLNHEYRADNVVASYAHTQGDGYKYLLPFKDSNNYLLQEMKPAIYAKTYFDRIFSNAGFSYTWDTLSAAHFDKLIIPFNGEGSLIDYNDFLVDATNAATLTNPHTSFWQPLTGWTEVTDALGIFDPSLGEYDVPLNLQGAENINFQFTVNVDINLVNSTGNDAYLVDTATSFVTEAFSYRPLFHLEKNGIPYSSSSPTGPNAFQFEGDTLAVGTTTIGTVQYTYQMLGGGLIATDLITIFAGAYVTPTSNALLWMDAAVGGSPVSIDVEMDYTSIEVRILPSSNILGYGAQIDMNNAVPNKVKQADFIKSIFTMYNLYTEQDNEVPNNLVLMHRDDYYDSGTEIDWTYKLAKDKDQALQFLPELSAKKLILTYKNDSDDPNKIYFEATKEIYGQLEFIFDNEYVKGIDTKEITFSPTPIGQSTFNAYLPLLSGAPKVNIRILQDGGEGVCDAYNLYNYGTTGETNVTTYPIFHHWDNPTNPTFDILFAQPDYMFYEGYSITNNNLYNLYWRRTVNQINVGKMLTAYFNLREDDIQSLKLNSKVRIDNSWWTINKVIDYDCNAQNLTKVELMSADTEIDLAPFKKGSVTPTTVGDLASHTGSIHFNNSFVGNVVPGTSVSAIYGQGNVIQPGVNGIIVGNNKMLDQTGISTERIAADVANIRALSLSGGIKYPLIKTNVDYYITTNDYLIICDGVNIYLPLSSIENQGQVHVIKTESSTSIVYTLGSDVIELSLTSVTLLPYESVMLVDNGGTGWYII
jgi:hypothetical protein